MCLSDTLKKQIVQDTHSGITGCLLDRHQHFGRKCYPTLSINPDNEDSMLRQTLVSSALHDVTHQKSTAKKTADLEILFECV